MLPIIYLILFFIIMYFFGVLPAIIFGTIPFIGLMLIIFFLPADDPININSPK